MIGNNLVKEDNHLGAIEQYTRYCFFFYFLSGMQYSTGVYFPEQLCLMQKTQCITATERLLTINWAISMLLLWTARLLSRLTLLTAKHTAEWGNFLDF